MNPKVSIITPVYKVEQYIADCVNSVIEQTYNHIEFVLVDDCGGDQSIHIAEQLLNSHTQDGFSFQIIKHKFNQGVSAARNHAMQAATGDYIFCLDSDDRLLPTSIATLVEKAMQTEADIVMCCHCSEGDAMNRGGMMCAPIDEINGTTEILNALANHWFNVAPWCKLIKRNMIINHQIYFYEGIINEDNPWTFKLCLTAQKIAFVHKALYFYRYNENSIMSSSKQDNIIKSNKIAVSIFLSEIYKHTSLWCNKSLYIIYMRQVVNYYTLMFTFNKADECKRYMKQLENFQYETPYFSPIAKSIPLYYRCWNIAFKLPYAFQYIYVQIIINLQKQKSK